VDTLTIDYRKTLNEYKNKIMEDIRAKAIRNSKLKESPQKLLVSIKDREKAFVDCLKGDHTRNTFEKKRLIRDSNI
jgi:hypothetical protein